jgi:hypothetical protein
LIDLGDVYHYVGHEIIQFARWICITKKWYLLYKLKELICMIASQLAHPWNLASIFLFVVVLLIWTRRNNTRLMLLINLLVALWFGPWFAHNLICSL